ncbi:MAG: hypothetical protein LBR30_07235 [Clostridioides sp.]|jgi:putative ABC transport system permease protein|nr:hypothetical protein [Clostridioides sp.]
MVLFNLSVRNIKKNFKNYSIYFVSLVFNVMIYFTFVSIRYNEQLANLLKGNKVILSSFNGAAGVLAVFSVMFIGYSTSFFLKKRKKEMGLYSLLGVKKSEIGFMIFYENIVMGIAAIILGIILGSVLCNFYIIILIRLINLSLNISFSLSSTAIFSTFKVFGLLFLCISIYGYRIIYKFKLIELFKAEKTIEKTKKPRMILGILSVVMLLAGYYVGFITEGSSISFTRNMPVVMVLVIAGTYLFFGSFLNMACKMIKNNKGYYFRGTRLIEVSNFAYKIKTNARTLATIVILSATTITSIASVYSMYKTTNRVTRETMPYSFVYESLDKNDDKTVESIIKKHPENKLISKEEVQYLKATGVFENVNTDEIKNKEASNIKKGETYNISVISESDANRILKSKDIEENISLKNDADVCFMQYSKEKNKAIENQNISIKFGNVDKNANSNASTNSDKKSNGEQIFRITNQINYPVMDSEHTEYTIVVKDNIYNDYKKTQDVFRLVAYNVENQNNSKDLTKELMLALPIESNLASAYEMTDVILLMAFLVFVGFFLGLVFLISTGSIIYFKQLTDAVESKDRYLILEKIGVSSKEIKKSVYKQVFVVFLLPLILAIVHSSVALFMLSKILLQENITLTVVMIMVIYTFIYFIYYLMTAKSYNKIVNNQLN